MGRLQGSDSLLDPASRLARRLDTRAAVFVGLGAMIGSGVFVVIAPATQAVGNALPLALLIAAAIAYLNAHSVVQLARLYPESGGVYVYGTQRLGPFWGFLAGWGFVVGKLASCSVMALAFGHYFSPQYARASAVGAVLFLTGVNCFGIQKTLVATRTLLALVLLSLGVVVFAGLSGGTVEASRLWPWQEFNLRDLLQASGLLFFAFAGYARLATLGEEVIKPAQTIPRAILIALGITLGIYALISFTALLSLEVSHLERSTAPLAEIVQVGRWQVLLPVVRLGATLACLGVLLSLLAGVGRTTFAMAANADLPKFLAKVHTHYKVPVRAELAAGILVALLVCVGDLRSAIGFSSFAVLVYYAIAHASAWTLDSSQRRAPRLVSVVGFLGCLVVALSLPESAILGGIGVLGLGSLVWFLLLRPYGKNK
jgi:basic amino acid/polyamine antiporter, APA family